MILESLPSLEALAGRVKIISLFVPMFGRHNARPVRLQNA